MMIRLSLLLLAGLLVGCGAETAVSTPAVDAQPAAGTLSPDDADLQTVSLNVESMHCPFACWPKVRETLREQPGVAGVELAPQADPNAIDNPVIHIRVRDSFDPASALAALAEAGFDDAQVASTP